MSYIGTEPKDIRSFGRTKFDYTATQGQTAFTGADDDGKVLAFTVGQIEVYVNGILMDDSDFTTTGTGTVTLASAANLNDVVNVVSFETNIPDSNYVPASGGTFTGNVTHSGTVTNSGNVTVGGTLGVTGAVTASNGLTVDDDGATPLIVDRATNDGTIIDVQKDGTSVGSIKSEAGSGVSLSNPQSNSYIALLANNQSNGIFYEDGTSKRFTPYSSRDNDIDLGYATGRWKDLYLSGGAYLGGTGAANKLDDYEEGNFTPNLSFATAGNSSVGYSARTGKYVKVGKIVTFQLEMRMNGVTQGTGSGHPIVGGFPFNFYNSGGYGGSYLTLSLQYTGISSGHIPYAWGNYNSNFAYLVTMSNSSANTSLTTPATYAFIGLAGSYVTTG